MPNQQDSRPGTPDPGFEPTIPQLLASATRRFGEREFIVTPDSRVTFSEVNQRSFNLATHLIRHGAGKGSRIGVLMGNTPEWVIAFMAAARIGGLVVPLSTFYTPEEVRRALRQADISILVVRDTVAGRSVRPLLESVGTPNPDAQHRIFIPEVPYLRHVLVMDSTDAGPWTAVDTYVPADETAPLVPQIEAEVVPSDMLSVILTSGTTGTQKAVMHTHGALVRHSWGLTQFQSIPESRTTYTGAPFFWVGGLVAGILAHLHFGGRLLTQERLDPDSMVDFLKRERPDVLFGFNLLDRLRQSPKFTDGPQDWLPAIGAGHRGTDEALRHHNTLGMSETAGAYSGPGDEANRTLPPDLFGSFGRPMPGVSIKIIDPQTGLRLPEGEEGEICVRSYSLMDGLYKRERRDVFDVDGWYHTADLGRLYGGCLFFTGRLNDTIRTKGANISPEEVQIALEKTGFSDGAIVFGIDDVLAGEVVVAVLTMSDPDLFDEPALREELKPLLSAYKVPKRFKAVRSLPLLPSGKPDKMTMRGWFGGGAS